jgi:hypothetical protein
MLSRVLMSRSTTILLDILRKAHLKYTAEQHAIQAELFSDLFYEI